MDTKPEEIYRPVIDLEEDVAIVTGATGGLGRAITIALAEHGAAIGAIAKDKKGLKELSHEVGEIGRPYRGISADVRELEEIEAAFREIYDELGSIDILVNGAGLTAGKNIRNSARKDLMKGMRLEMETNHFGTIHCSVTAAEYMRKGYGRIINIGSIRAETAGTSSGYSPSKAAVIADTKQLAVELARSGITVNCISPTHIDAGIFGRKPRKEKERYLKDIPLGRFGRPEDVAYWVCCFALDKGGYVTGQNLPVDGGYLCRR